MSDRSSKDIIKESVEGMLKQAAVQAGGPL